MLQLFVSVEARQEANLSYHQYEWSILANLRLAKNILNENSQE
jgi:hypothetical protein